jgi:hypothetical protein
VNKPTRRVRGNSTPPDDLPIQYWHRDDEPEKTPEDTAVDFLIGLCIIVAFILLVMFVAGRFV